MSSYQTPAFAVVEVLPTASEDDSACWRRVVLAGSALDGATEVDFDSDDTAAVEADDDEEEGEPASLEVEVAEDDTFEAESGTVVIVADPLVDMPSGLSLRVLEVIIAP